MEWTDISITVAKRDADTAEAIATMVANGGIYIEDYSDLEQQAWEIAHVDLIEQELLDKPRDVVIVHMYLAPDENPAEVLPLFEERLKNVVRELGEREVLGGQAHVVARALQGQVQRMPVTPRPAQTETLHDLRAQAAPLYVGPALLGFRAFEGRGEMGRRQLVHAQHGLAGRTPLPVLFLPFFVNGTNNNSALALCIMSYNYL